MANTKSIDLELSSSQYLSKTDSASLDITAGITLMGWVNFESLPAGASAPLNRQVFASKWSGSGDAQRAYYFFYFWRNVSSQYELGISTTPDGVTQDAPEIVSASSFFNTGTWYHLAMTRSSTTFKVYINGTQTGGDQAVSTATIHNSSFPFMLGAADTGVGATNFLDGKMDEIGLYNAELSAATILADYNSGNGTERSSGETGIVAGWRFEDNLLDVTANDNDLTNNNSAQFSTDVPFGGGTPTVSFIPRITMS